MGGKRGVALRLPFLWWSAVHAWRGKCVEREMRGEGSSVDGGWQMGMEWEGGSGRVYRVARAEGRERVRKRCVSAAGR